VFQRRPALEGLQGYCRVPWNECRVNVKATALSGVLRAAVRGVEASALWAACAIHTRQIFPTKNPAPVTAIRSRANERRDPANRLARPLPLHIHTTSTCTTRTPPAQSTPCGKHAFLAARPRHSPPRRTLTRHAANTSSTPRSPSARRAVGSPAYLTQNRGSSRPGKKWFDCAECHAEQADHTLMQTFDLTFICKKCKKAFRKDAREMEDA